MTLTKSPRTGTGKIAPVVTKRTKPSKPGEKVRIPASPEVRVAEDAAKSKAKVDATIGKAVAKMTQRDEDAAAASIARDDKDRREAVLSINDDHEAKTKGHIPPKGKAKGSTKAASVHRLTTEWTGKDKKDVAVKDRVKAGDGTVLDVIGRWTKKTAKGNVPMVTGHVVSSTTASVSVEGKDKKVGDRCNAVAATVTHVTKK